MIQVKGTITDPIAHVIAAAIEYGRDLTANETDGVWDITISDQEESAGTPTPFDLPPAEPEPGENTPVSPFG